MGNLISFLDPAKLKRRFCNAQTTGLSPSQTEDTGQKGFGSETCEREDTKTNVSSADEKPPEEPQSNDTSYGVEATAVRTLAASTGTVAILGTTAKVKDSNDLPPGETNILDQQGDNPSISVTEPDPSSDKVDTDDEKPETPLTESERNIDEKERKQIENVKIQESSAGIHSSPGLPEEKVSIETEVESLSQDSRIQTTNDEDIKTSGKPDGTPKKIQPTNEPGKQTQDQEPNLPKIIDYHEKIDVPPDEPPEGKEDEITKDVTQKTESLIESVAEAVATPSGGGIAQSDVSSDEDAKFSTKSEAGSPEASKTEEENDISSEQLKTNSLSDMSLSEALNSDGEEAAREAAKAQELQEMVASLSAEAKEATLGYEEAMGIVSESDLSSSSKDEFKPGFLIPISGQDRWLRDKQKTSAQEEILLKATSPITEDQEIPEQAQESPSEKSESSVDSKQTEESKISDRDDNGKIDITDLPQETKHEDQLEEEKVCDDLKINIQTENEEDKRLSAATTIQSAFRGYKERKQLHVNGFKENHLKELEHTDEVRESILINTAIINLARLEVDNICKEAEEKVTETLTTPPPPEISELEYQYDSEDFPAPPDDLININGKNEISKENVDQHSSGTPTPCRTVPYGSITESDSSKTEDTTAPSMLEYENKPAPVQQHVQETEKGDRDEKKPEEESEVQKDNKKSSILQDAPESIVKIAQTEVDKICQEASEKATETLMTPPPPEMTTSEYQDDSEDFPAPPDDLVDINGKTDSAKDDQESSGTPSSDRTMPLGSNTEGDSSKTEDTTAPSILESEIKLSTPVTASQQIEDHQESSLTDDNINTEVPVARDSTEGELTMEEDSKEEELAPTSVANKPTPESEWPTTDTETTATEASKLTQDSEKSMPEPGEPSLDQETTTQPTPDINDNATESGRPTPETTNLAIESGRPIPDSKDQITESGIVSPTPESGRPSPDSKESVTESERPKSESNESEAKPGEPNPDFSEESGRPKSDQKESITESGRPSPYGEEKLLLSATPIPNTTVSVSVSDTENKDNEQAKSPENLDQTKDFDRQTPEGEELPAIGSIQAAQDAKRTAPKSASSVSTISMQVPEDKPLSGQSSSSDSKSTHEEEASSQENKTGSTKSGKEQDLGENKQQLSSESNESKEQAAKVIQAGFRGFKTRKDLKKDNAYNEVSTKTHDENKNSSKITDESNTESSVETDAVNASPNHSGNPLIQGETFVNGGLELQKEEPQPESADKLQSSAIKIQAGVRGYLVRKEQKLKQEAAVKIQSTFRGFKTRQRLKQESS